MSLNPNQTYAGVNNNLYISRAEVLEAISSIGGLSTISNLFTTPNPLFSTITMNPNGLIGGFAPIRSSNVVFATTSPVVNAAAQLKLGTVGNQSTNALVVADSLGNTGVMRAQRYIANIGGVNGYGAGWSFTNAGFVYVDGNDAQTPVITAPVGAPQNIALQNISSINGSAVGQQITTYTNLTGSNITNSQVIQTPSIVGISSLNGSNINTFANQQLWVSRTISPSTSNVNMTANVPQTIFTINNLPVTVAVGRYINVSIPMGVSPASGSAATQINVTFTAYIGGNVTQNTGVAATACLSPGSANNNRLATITGVVSANGPTNVLTIQAVCDQTVALSFAITAFFNQIFFQQVV